MSTNATGGDASWQEVHDQLLEALPEADELPRETGEV